MALAIFIFNGIKTAIQCVKEDKMKNICAKYASRIDKELNSLYFLYDGNHLNNELTFYEQANSLDKQNLEMNILVIPNKDSNELKYPKCRHNPENINSPNDSIKYNKT